MANLPRGEKEKSDSELPTEEDCIAMGRDDMCVECKPVLGLSNSYYSSSEHISASMETKSCQNK